MAFAGAFMVPHPPIILKEIGGSDIEKAEKTVSAYTKVAKEIAEIKPETIIITSPHSVMYADYFHISPGNGAKGNMGQFGRPEISFDVEYDAEFTDTLSKIAKKADFPAGTLGEKKSELDHGTMVPLYFINKEYSDYKLIRIGLSGLSLKDHYRFGQMIKETVEKLNRKVVFVASGDLSHKLLAEGPYGFVPEGPEYDKRIMEVMGSADFGKLLEFNEHFLDKAAECGHRSFCIMAGAFDGMKVEGTELSHEGPFGVGYGICSFRIADSVDPDPSREFLKIAEINRQKKLEEIRSKEDAFISLARSTVETYTKTGITPKLPSNLPDKMMKKRAGVFVSIHKEGQLRGCIGTISPVYDCIGEEIIENAVAASSRDPRFSPIRPDELDYLDISVDVLSEAEDISSKDELDVKRYGVIVSKDGRRGLLLPNLEGVDTVDEQVSIALQKAGLSPYAKDYKLQRFEVVRHEV
ncbi:MAG: AmmeMemoRadiSam system protein A [Lachnospiraceae bacterium]|nr:AmmeMemoRadiSam system protein A [Lachnospiraceae bacterium]